MTAATHPLRMPSWQAVLREQFSTSLLVLRPFFYGAAAVLLFGDALLIKDVILGTRIPHPKPWNTLNVSFGPEESVIAVVFAIVLALLLWIDDDRARRAYHWSMPIARRRHAFLKIAAGWLAAMGLTIALIGNVLLLSAAAAHIQHQPAHLLGVLPWWTLLVPLTSVTVGYALASAACVGAQRPIVWVVGLPVLYFGLVTLCSSVALLKRFSSPILTLWSGRYGMSPMLGMVLGDSGQPAQGAVPQWLLTVAVWAAGALALLIFAANRPPETT